jgi:hypothetical protein
MLRKKTDPILTSFITHSNQRLIGPPKMSKTITIETAVTSNISMESQEDANSSRINIDNLEIIFPSSSLSLIPTIQPSLCDFPQPRVKIIMGPYGPIVPFSML